MAARRSVDGFLTHRPISQVRARADGFALARGNLHHEHGEQVLRRIDPEERPAMTLQKDWPTEPMKMRNARLGCALRKPRPKRWPGRDQVPGSAPRGRVSDAINTVFLRPMIRFCHRSVCAVQQASRKTGIVLVVDTRPPPPDSIPGFSSMLRAATVSRVQGFGRERLASGRLSSPVLEGGIGHLPAWARNPLGQEGAERLLAGRQTSMSGRGCRRGSGCSPFSAGLAQISGRPPTIAACSHW